MKKKSVRAGWKFALNGLSIDSLTVSQDGELEVEFDLPSPQVTDQYQSHLRGVRSFDIYEDKELEDACRRLFQLVRRRVQKPDPERERVHCDQCSSSACCRNYNVLVTPEDMERLARHLGLTAEKFRRRFTVPAVDWCGDFPAQLDCDEDSEDGEEKCVFLKRTSTGQLRCSVYEHRPQICRDFDMKTCDDFVPVEKVKTLPKAVTRS